MGFLSGIFGRGKEPEQKGASDVSASELTGRLESRLAELELSFGPDMKKLHDKILASTKDLSESMARLEAAKCATKIDDAVMKLATSFRASLIKSFNQPFMDAAKPTEHGMEPFKRYFAKLSASLVEAEKDAMRYVPPMKDVFPGETRDMLKKVDKLEEVITEVKEFLEAKAAQSGPLSVALADSRDLEAELAKAAQLEARMKDLETDLSQLTASKQANEAKISELMRSELWAGHMARKGELSQLKRRTEDVRNLIVQTIISMDRPMKRLRKAVIDGRETVEGPGILESYIGNPFEAFQQDDGTNLEEFVTKISALSKRGEMELEEKERRMFEKASELNEMLAKMRADYGGLERETARLEEELATSEVVLTNSRLSEEMRLADLKISANGEDKAKVQSMLAKSKESVSQASEKVVKSASSALGEEIRIRTPQLIPSSDAQVA
ncbi:MAG: hypothetical protein HY833_02515 [Candidatus Aenigmarchaeota archaeon]|nr:hypothetical protein [Candidatus Aenigmarchaeota archaeon]